LVYNNCTTSQITTGSRKNRLQTTNIANLQSNLHKSHIFLARPLDIVSFFQLLADIRCSGRPTKKKVRKIKFEKKNSHKHLKQSKSKQFMCKKCKQKHTQTDRQTLEWGFHNRSCHNVVCLCNTPGPCPTPCMQMRQQMLSAKVNR